MRKLGVLSSGILLAGLAVGQGKCDRACLNGFVDEYLDAMVAHDIKLVPLARNAKFTENGQKLEWGDGLWNTMATTKARPARLRMSPVLSKHVK
jgi:hypothetical protein